MFVFASAVTAVRGADSTDIDYFALKPPEVGSSELRILSPNLLELVLINTKSNTAAPMSQWDLVDGNNQFKMPAASAFSVTANGQQIAVSTVGFKRRPLYAPLAHYDLRIENCLYLQLAQPVSDGQQVQVTNPDGTLWGAGPTSTVQFSDKVDPLRYSPAIHVNQEGYLLKGPKKAMVGYYAGSLGEMSIPVSSGFTIVDATTGKQVYQGSLVQRKDSGYTYTPAPYQQVYEADFTPVKKTGEYRLVVPGMGGSLPFYVNDGIAMSFARAYALGLYHQRCGTNTALPFTRFTHGVCHSAPAQVPTTAAAAPFTWNTISNYSQITNPDNPVQKAPALTGPAAQLFPFVKQGPVDVTGGHHDAGDYSKYTINSASLIHYLIFAVDSLPGVAALDNLGIPESGDKISDVMQEAKWEADFVSKMQDSDGGFYFLVYPTNREYEINVTPDHGDGQVVWPKTTSVTAASVAALAEMGTSPYFKKAYPEVAAKYLSQAQLGWAFLTNAIGKYGKDSAYQKITHYGDNFADRDELAWAACQMYLATGDPSIHQLLLAWFDPSDPATKRWSWWHMSECYGHAMRSYAFAVQSKRITADKLDQTFLKKCQNEIAAAGEDILKWSQDSAYGTSFPTPTKAVQSAGWYFSTDQAFDMVVAYQLNKKQDYVDALIANMNYEGGCNPVNVSYVTGLGWKRQMNIVSQWALNAPRVMPPSGLPVGNVQAAFFYLWNYQTELEQACFPSDGGSPPYPYYDRWGDVWNVSTEMVVLNSARSLASLTWLAAQTTLKPKAYKPGPAKIKMAATVAVGSPVTASLVSTKTTLKGARFVWEAQDQDPAYGDKFTFTPKKSGPQWVEVEAELPDGRRVFASGSITAQ
jgi:hypothetical protein